MMGGWPLGRKERVSVGEVSQQDKAHGDPYERLCWLHNPVCLERREEEPGEAPPFHFLSWPARKVGGALARVLRGLA